MTWPLHGPHERARLPDPVQPLRVRCARRNLDVSGAHHAAGGSKGPSQQGLGLLHPFGARFPQAGASGTLRIGWSVPLLWNI